MNAESRRFDDRGWLWTYHGDRDPLEVWRDTFGSAEFVVECAQSELWLGDVDTPPEATLEEIEQQAASANTYYRNEGYL